MIGGRGPLAALALAALLPAAGAGAQDEPVSGTAEVLTNQLGELSRARPRGAMEAVRVFFDEGALRMQFTDNAGAAYALVLPAGSATGWLVGGRGGAMPVPKMRWPIRFDPDRPCEGQGLFADCQRVGEGLYAGRNARQWRYRLGNGTGPGMTRQGWMWLDAETGLVLAYEGRTGLEQVRRWQVREVRYGPLPGELFEAPSSVQP